MKKYEIVVDDAKAEELKKLLEGLPYVKNITQSGKAVNSYSKDSEEVLDEDWNSEEDDELQKMYGK